MHITKADDILLLLGYQSRGGLPTLTVTAAYVVEADGSRMDEGPAWAWLKTRITDEAFDVGLKKSHGTFAVAGAACAPQGQRVAAMAISARVDQLEKTLHVHGDRQWRHGARGWQATPAIPFDTMPVTLSRAWGGADCTSNPYGVGALTDADAAEGTPLPNIELASTPLLQPAQALAPASFGPLPPGSPARTRWLGQFDALWLRTRAPWVPDDTDPRWFDGVAQDQCMARYWRGDESWGVRGMHPTQPAQEGRLPGLRPRILLQRDTPSGTMVEEARADLDTVWLFPTDTRVAVLYRAEVLVRNEAADDITGIAVFTERMQDPALPLAHWQKHWEALLAKPMEVPPPEPAEDVQADITAVREQLAQRAADHAKSVWTLLSSSYAQSTDEAQALLASAQAKRPPGGPRLPAIPREPYPSLSQLLEPAPPPAVSKNLASDIDSALQQGMAEARKILDARLGPEQAQAALSRPSEPATLAALLANAPISAAERKQALDQAASVQGEIDAMRKTLAAHQITLQQQAAQATVEAVQEQRRQEAIDAARQPADRPRVSADRAEVLARHAQGQSLSSLHLENLDLTGLDFSGADFSGSLLQHCRLDDTQLDGARFVQAELEDCTLRKASLKEVLSTDALLTRCLLGEADCTSSQWIDARLDDCDLSDAHMARSTLTRAVFNNVLFKHADLAGAQAQSARFTLCDFYRTQAQGSCLNEAALENCTLDATLFTKASLQTTTISASRGNQPDFQDAMLRGLRLDSHCVLANPRFDRADLTRASLRDSLLTGANFSAATLDDALIQNCDLSGSNGWRLSAVRASLAQSRLTGASWIAANLMYVSFDRALLQDFDASGANLHAADTRTAQVAGMRVDGALLTRCNLLQEHTHD
jgi:uncharacterized protein YjbI with pentapeptide repeats